MKNLSFVIWVMGYPVMSMVEMILVKKYLEEVSEVTEIIFSIITFIIYILVAFLVYEK